MKIETKICKKCKISKPCYEFYHCKHAKDGLHAYCKECWKIRSGENRKKNPELNRAYFKKWYENNKDRHSELRKKYRENNKEKTNESSRKFMRKYRESIPDCYVKLLLKSQGYTNEQIEANPSLIEIKRAVLKDKRLKRAEKNKPKTP